MEAFFGSALPEGARLEVALVHPSRPWNGEDLMRVLRGYRSMVDVENGQEVKPETLWISEAAAAEEARAVRIPGLDGISRFCASETFEDVAVIQRQIERSEDVKGEWAIDIHMEAVVESEIPAPALDAEEADRWRGAAKRYRIVKEIRYTGLAMGTGVAFVASMVRDAPSPATSMVASRVSEQGTEIRFGIELDAAHASIDAVQSAWMRAIQILMQEYVPIGMQKKADVLAGYQLLLEPFLEGHRGRRGDTAASIAPGGGFVFLNPKPFTLERRNLAPPSDDDFGQVTILKGYAVTDKADGERMLMYIDSEGHAYFININSEVRALDWDAPSHRDTIIDGEFIPFSQMQDSTATKDVFAAFDIYVHNGKPVYDLPLISAVGGEGRYGILQRVCNVGQGWNSGHDCLDLVVKRHIGADGDEMFEACRSFLNDQARPYRIDGLVFTPRDLPVLGYYPVDPGSGARGTAAQGSTARGTTYRLPASTAWERLFKWKPPSQNTIDFLVQSQGYQTDPTTKRRFAAYGLYTGYDVAQHTPLTPMVALEMLHDSGTGSREKSRPGSMGYRAERFAPGFYDEPGVGVALVPLNEAGLPTTEEGQVIHNNSIVEFRLNMDDRPVSQRWVPLRVREDKTLMFNRTKELTKTANDIRTAINIWKSMHEPITEAHISGYEPLPMGADVGSSPEELDSEDIYYARKIPRHRLLSVHMVNFHNLGVKADLYERPPIRLQFHDRQKPRLLELACGMGGDLTRWKRFGFVLGVDLVVNNITKPRDGAYARLLDMKARNGWATNAVFVVGDCAKPLRNGDAAKGLDTQSEEILRLMYNPRKVVMDQRRKFLDGLVGRAVGGFETVSCMAAVHYFFRSDEMLDGFLRNVSDNLRPGGIFIAIFMDGREVHRQLEATKDGRLLGTKKNGAATVWAILRRYAGYVPGSEDPNSIYGKTIDVYLENTSRLIPEFLVDMDTLVRRAKERGMSLPEGCTGTFEQKFNEFRSQLDAGEPLPNGLREAIQALSTDEVQKRFSFLHRWVVFQKDGGPPAAAASARPPRQQTAASSRPPPTPRPQTAAASARPSATPRPQTAAAASSGRPQATPRPQTAAASSGKPPATPRPRT